MGLFATGTRAFGKSAGFEVKVSREAPGPQRMTAWKPGEGRVAWGIAKTAPLLLVLRKRNGGTNCLVE